MNEDFGVGRRRTTNSPELPRPVAPHVTHFQPASRSTPQLATHVRSDQPSDQRASSDPNPITSSNPLVRSSSLGSSDDDLRKHFTNAYTSDTTGNGGNGSGANNIPGSSESKPGKGPKGRLSHLFGRIKTFFANLTKKQWIIIGVAVLVLTAGSATALALLSKDDAPVKTVSKAKEKVEVVPEKPKSPLTGIEVSEEDTKRPVIGVMIENSTFARPQSGLKDAGVVYEAIAEYGITRFLALYQEAAPGNIGPVRSARPYYVDWAHAYDASYAHVGGSPDGLAKIKSDGIRDLDQFYNSGAYRRIGEREAPHNVYTTMAQLRDLTASKGWTSSTFTGLARKKEAPAKTVTANSIDIAISGADYNVHYDYDAASNTYLRTMAGQPHNDADSGSRLAPKVVIGLATSYGLMADGYHSTYTTTGTGAVKIFQDGVVTEGTWTREGNNNYKFQDAGGKEIALDPGQTWITVVGDPAAIRYTAPAPTAP